MLLLRNARADLIVHLDAYAADFEWYCFCMACGHAPSRGHESLQSLYLAQARHQGARMAELYPLVCAHWDAVNAARDLAECRHERDREALQRALREAKARHRSVAQKLRAAWQG